MEEKRILTITKTDGSKEQVEEVISFEFNDTKKRYVVYTKNEKDENGNVTIYVTRIVSDENGHAKTSRLAQYKALPKPSNTVK